MSLGWSGRSVFSAILIAGMICGHARPALAYLKFGFDLNGRQVTLRWNTMPVRYFVTNQAVAGVSAADFQAAAARAFATWQAVPTAATSYVFGGFTANLPGEDDGRSTLGFLNEPDLDRVLASTNYLVDNATGALLEADIFSIRRLRGPWPRTGIEAAGIWKASPCTKSGISMVSATPPSGKPR
jgi:hypothetical protein